MEDNICSVYGNKFLTSLTSFVINTKSLLSKSNREVTKTIEHANQHEDADVIKEEKEDNDSDANIGGDIKIHVFVSKVGVGVGRSDNDKQFIFCNQRPVELSKFHRLFNDVSKIFVCIWLLCFAVLYNIDFIQNTSK